MWKSFILLHVCINQEKGEDNAVTAGREATIGREYRPASLAGLPEPCLLRRYGEWYPGQASKQTSGQSGTMEVRRRER